MRDPVSGNHSSSGRILSRPRRPIDRNCSKSEDLRLAVPDAAFRRSVRLAVRKMRDLRRVVSAGIPRMTAADSPQSLPASRQNSVLSDGQNEVLAAGRVETARSSQQRAQCPLVAAHQKDHHRCGNMTQEVRSGHHCVPGAGSERSRGTGSVRSRWFRTSFRWAGSQSSVVATPWPNTLTSTGRPLIIRPQGR